MLSTIMPIFSLMVADTFIHSMSWLEAICAWSAGSANEEWAYELFKSIQSIFISIAVLVGVGPTVGDYSIKKEENHCWISSLAGWQMGFEPTVFRTTIWRSNQLNYSHHVSAFLKCGAKIWIIFESAKKWMKKISVLLLFFVFTDSDVVFLKQAAGVIYKDFQSFTRFFWQ